MSSTNNYRSLNIKSGYVIRGKYRLIQKLGEGAFGSILLAENTETKDKCAIKIESFRNPKLVLKMEVAVLRKVQGKPHFAKVFSCGKDPTGEFSYVVMSLFGPNLSELRKENFNRFSLSTSLRIGKQISVALQHLHTAGFLHRDIKPSNFVIGRHPSQFNQVFMIDFGLSREYLSPSGSIRRKRERTGFRGTIRYASLNAHKNLELGRHDDMISMLYMIIEFIKGTLPWVHEKETSAVIEKKKNTTLEELCRDVPRQLFDYATTVMSLDYETKPPYAELLNHFESAMEELNIKESDPFEWEVNPKQFRCLPSSKLVLRTPLATNNKLDMNISGQSRKPPISPGNQALLKGRATSVTRINQTKPISPDSENRFPMSPFSGSKEQISPKTANRIIRGLSQMNLNEQQYSNMMNCFRNDPNTFAMAFDSGHLDNSLKTINPLDPSFQSNLDLTKLNGFPMRRTYSLESNVNHTNLQGAFRPINKPQVIPEDSESKQSIFLDQSNKNSSSSSHSSKTKPKMPPNGLNRLPTYNNSPVAFKYASTHNINQTSINNYRLSGPSLRLREDIFDSQHNINKISQEMDFDPDGEIKPTLATTGFLRKHSTGNKDFRQSTERISQFGNLEKGGIQKKPDRIIPNTFTDMYSRNIPTNKKILPKPVPPSAPPPPNNRLGYGRFRRYRPGENFDELDIRKVLDGL